MSSAQTRGYWLCNDKQTNVILDKHYEDKLEATKVRKEMDSSDKGDVSSTWLKVITSNFESLYLSTI